MNKAFVSQMKQQLLETKTEIFGQMAHENEEFRALIEDSNPKDLGDIAASDIDRNTLEAVGKAEVRRLNLIDAALSRIENDKYGVCMSCGTKIPQARLEAIPYAILCISCQSNQERRDR